MEAQIVQQKASPTGLTRVHQGCQHEALSAFQAVIRWSLLGSEYKLTLDSGLTVKYLKLLTSHTAHIVPSLLP